MSQEEEEVWREGRRGRKGGGGGGGVRRVFTDKPGKDTERK